MGLRACSGSEFYSEGNLALSIADVRALCSDLPKGAVTYVVVGTIELGSVEGVEVVDGENRLPPLANVEILLGINVFQQLRGISHSPVVPFGIADDVLRWSLGEGGRVIHLRNCGIMLDKPISCAAVGSGA
jgi:hypothetical protein